MLLPFDTTVRSIEFDDRAAHMQLRPWQWEFLLAIDGRMRLGDLARSCGIDFETASELVTETQTLGLVEIVTLSLEEYRSLAPPRAVPSGPPAAVSDPAKKGVSVSFDSFSSMLADWDAPPFEPNPAPVAPSAHADPVPIDFDVPPPQSFGHLSKPPALELAPSDVVPEPAPSISPAQNDSAGDAPSNPKPAPKSLSFSLSADSFGLPVEPVEAPALAPVPAVASHRAEPPAAAKQDDAGISAAVEPPVTASQGDEKPGDDLTGNVLRALGLRK